MRTLKIASFTLVSIVSLLLSCTVVVAVLFILPGKNTMQELSRGLIIGILLTFLVNRIFMSGVTRLFVRSLDVSVQKLMQVGTLGVPLVVVMATLLRDYVRDHVFRYGDMWSLDQRSIDFTTATLPIVWFTPMLFVWLWRDMLQPELEKS